MVKRVMMFSVVLSLLLLFTCQITWAGQEEETTLTTPIVPVTPSAESKNRADQDDQKIADVFHGMVTLGAPFEISSCTIL